MFKNKEIFNGPLLRATIDLNGVRPILLTHKQLNLEYHSECSLINPSLILESFLDQGHSDFPGSRGRQMGPRYGAGGKGVGTRGGRMVPGRMLKGQVKPKVGGTERPCRPPL